MLEFLLWALRRSQRKCASAGLVQIEIFQKLSQSAGSSDALLSPFRGEIPKANELNRALRDIQNGSCSPDDLQQIASDSIATLRKFPKRVQ